MSTQRMNRLVILASGSGSNAENIARYFGASDSTIVSLILTNNPKAKVLDRAKSLELKAMSFNRYAFKDSSLVLKLIKGIDPDLIVLAGFLWKIPEAYIKAFPYKIINIHPALLPDYGGKGMYGRHVHEAVIANNETKSGISIHYVNEHYDEGAMIFQASCDISPSDTAEDLAKKIHALEMEHFPKVIESLLNES